MIVDYNLFEPGVPLRNGTLWLAEQLPGYIRTGDVTDILKSQKYWASYNSPYFSDVYTMSGRSGGGGGDRGAGVGALVAKYGDWFTYDHTPR
jgi:hypothetical protein